MAGRARRLELLAFVERQDAALDLDLRRARLLRSEQAALLVARQLPQLVAIDLERERILALELAGVEQRRRQHHGRGETSARRR